MTQLIICNIPDHTLRANIKALEIELAHLVYTHNDPIECLEWLDLYNKELAIRRAVSY